MMHDDNALLSKLRCFTKILRGFRNAIPGWPKFYVINTVH